MTPAQWVLVSIAAAVTLIQCLRWMLARSARIERERAAAARFDGMQKFRVSILPNGVRVLTPESEPTPVGLADVKWTTGPAERHACQWDNCDQDAELLLTDDDLPEKNGWWCRQHGHLVRIATVPGRGLKKGDSNAENV